MSRNYDNWERLVAAVLKREQFRQLCRCTSLSSSFSSVSSDFSDLSIDSLIVQQTPLYGYFQLYDPISLANNYYHPLWKPSTLPSVPPNGEAGGAALRSPALVTGLAWYRRKRLSSFFFTGVPKLKISELETACEKFSNVVVCYSMNCRLFKGTLSSGVAIAVASTTVASGHWSDSHEAQFQKKIDMLSSVNHKNFVNVLGYCAQEKYFARLMVFEYVPNGTLFEYLHIKQTERLDWAMRLRIAMGIAYCLKHMHQLTPPLAHRNLGSFAVYLTEDYAAKLSDFDNWDEGASAQMQPNVHDNVSSFGFILLEMITGKLPQLMCSDSWLLDFLRGEIPNLSEVVDPTLETFEEDQLEQIGGVIKSCVNPNTRNRPSMKEICAWLSEITAIGPDGAIPKYLHLRDAELENLSIDAR